MLPCNKMYCLRIFLNSLKIQHSHGYEFMTLEDPFPVTINCDPPMFSQKIVFQLKEMQTIFFFRIYFFIFIHLFNNVSFIQRSPFSQITKSQFRIVHQTFAYSHSKQKNTLEVKNSQGQVILEFIQHIKKKCFIFFQRKLN